MMKLAALTCSCVAGIAFAIVSCERVPREPQPGLTSPEDERPPPQPAPLPWDENLAVQLVALPLSCIDRPQKASRRGTYLYETTRTLKSSYEDSLAFYGCSDWHSAVNSTWAMVKVLKEFPDVPIANLIREKLDHHLSRASLAGELEFFEKEAPPGFERPYGWAWLMRLQLELSSWDDPKASEWAENLTPLAELLAKRTLVYLDHLSGPIRIGTHDNTAFSLLFLFDYAEAVGDEKLRSAILARSESFFLKDRDCPLGYEPSGSDFLSPCLAEAVLMSRQLEPSRFVAWLDDFLPSPETAEFAPLGRPVEIKEHYLPAEPAPASPEPAESAAAAPIPETVSEPGPEPSEDDGEEATAEEPPAPDEETRLVGARSHLIGLSFVRAAAFRRLAAALPFEDRRGAVYRELATLHGKDGLEKMYDASYLGTHWLASFAIDMLTVAAVPIPLEREEASRP